jgi:23S rRNA U2552 (ribose-2'-O)-methylase RlmE/FtsJ
MNLLKLPYINKKITKEDIYIDFTIKSSELYPIINNSLYIHLKKSKELINNNSKLWDNYKKYTNPYEFIHTNYDNNSYISKLKPLSRSYYKMIEMCNIFNLLEFNTFNSINSFHLAEGPGGFIEALVKLRTNPTDNYYGMTLQDNNDINIPGWKKSNNFLSNNPNVKIENGADKTGNLYNINNYEYIYEKYKNSMSIVTADGGFDFSIDYSKQEILALRLILSQVIYAITLQKYKGHFILKFFDIFTKPSIDIIYLLSCFYEKVYIYKPNTSRYGNSEKYLICKYFKYENIDFIYNSFHNLIHTLIIQDYNNNLLIKNILNCEIPDMFKNSLTEINAIYGQQQIENINNTIVLLQNNNKLKEKIEKYKKNNIQKCIQWCINNNIPYNKNYINSNNIFLTKKK